MSSISDEQYIKLLQRENEALKQRIKELEKTVQNCIDASINCYKKESSNGA